MTVRQTADGGMSAQMRLDRRIGAVVLVLALVGALVLVLRPLEARACVSGDCAVVECGAAVWPATDEDSACGHQRSEALFLAALCLAVAGVGLWAARSRPSKPRDGQEVAGPIDDEGIEWGRDIVWTPASAWELDRSWDPLRLHGTPRRNPLLTLGAWGGVALALLDIATGLRASSAGGIAFGLGIAGFFIYLPEHDIYLSTRGMQVRGLRRRVVPWEHVARITLVPRSADFGTRQIEVLTIETTDDHHIAARRFNRSVNWKALTTRTPPERRAVATYEALAASLVEMRDAMLQRQSAGPEEA